MFESLPEKRASWRRAAASIVVHLCVLALIAWHPRVRAARVFLPGTSQGTHVEITYLPGRAPQPTISHKKAKPAAPVAEQLKRPDPNFLAPEPVLHALMPPPRPKLAPPREAAADEHAPPSPTPNALTGTDAMGSGDIQIALTVYSPSPKPDLSQLPHGTQGEVVLDVTIDTSGKVADLALLHPLGYGIDNAVVSTVRSWVFHPATENGVPVESVQELHFHYGPV